MFILRPVLALLIAIALVGCGASSSTAPQPTEAMMAESPTEAMMQEQPTEAMAMEEPTEVMMEEKPTDAMMAEEPTEAMMEEKPTDALMAEEPTEAMMEEKPTEVVMAETPTAAMAMEEPATALPAFATLTLTDARTGQSFTLADYAGKTIYVEPMATWCSKCREHMGNLREARAQLNSDQYVFIGLSVETDITSAELAQYVDQQGFDWTFAVMTPEMLQELVNTFGRTITNPPAVPHFVIAPDGTVSELMTGIETPEQIAMSLSEG